MIPFTNSNPHHQLTQYLLLLILFVTLTISSAGPVTMVVTVTAAPSSPSSPSYLSPSEFKNAVLSLTNTYRTQHNAVSLVWNDTLVTYAKDWAQKCMWKHSSGPYGENLAYGYPNASAAVSAWGEEALKYNFLIPTGFTEETGHFTQLVWKATTEVGCAAVDCGYDPHSPKDVSPKRAQGWYVVCEYVPAGNVVGRNNALFLDNVQAALPKLPLGESKQEVDSDMMPLRSHSSKTTEMGTATSAFVTAFPTEMSAAGGRGSGFGRWLAFVGLVMAVWG